MSNLDQSSRHRFEDYFLKQEDLTFINVTYHLDRPQLYDEIIELEGAEND